MDRDKRELAGWWMWILLLIVVSTMVFGALNYFGVIGQTVVERKVFENSYQYSAAQKQQIATYEAEIAELEGKLLDPKLDESDRANINAQLSSIRIQLAATKGRTK